MICHWQFYNQFHQTFYSQLKIVNLCTSHLSHSMLGVWWGENAKWNDSLLCLIHVIELDDCALRKKWHRMWMRNTSRQVIEWMCGVYKILMALSVFELTCHYSKSIISSFHLHILKSKKCFSKEFLRKCQ